MSERRRDAAARRLRALYGEAHGYTIPARDEATVKRARSSSVYGEIMPAAGEQLLAALRLGREDVLYDLGSGVGKFVLQAAMGRPLRKVVGVELAPSRHDIARGVLGRARRQGLIKARQVGLRCEDAMQTYLADATVIYTCSTAFPLGFMDRLARRLATLREGLTVEELDEPTHFDLRRVLRLDMSWQRRTPVYVYRLVSRRRRPRSARRR